MSKTMTIITEEKEYKLEFTRKTVQKMEEQGFVMSEISDKPATMIPLLFAGAFLVNHRFVKRDVINAIYDTIKNKDELLSKLIEMYQEPILSLMGTDDAEKSEEDEGNAIWEANF